MVDSGNVVVVDGEETERFLALGGCVAAGHGRFPSGNGIRAGASVAGGRGGVATLWSCVGGVGDLALRG